MKQTYELNLRGMTTNRFLANPLVLFNWNMTSPESVMGRVVDLTDTSVTIEYLYEVPKYEHFIGVSSWVNQETLERELLALSVLESHKDRQKFV